MNGNKFPRDDFVMTINISNQAFVEGDGKWTICACMSRNKTAGRWLYYAQWQEGITFSFNNVLYAILYDRTKKREGEISIL